MHSLTNLETRGPEPGCWQGRRVPSMGSRKESFLAYFLFLVVTSNWPSLPCSCITPVSASVFTGPSPLSVCLCICVQNDFFSPLYIKMLIVLFRVHRKPVWPHLNRITSAKILVPNKVIFWNGYDCRGGGHYSTQWRWYSMMARRWARDSGFLRL